MDAPPEKLQPLGCNSAQKVVSNLRPHMNLSIRLITATEFDTLQHDWNELLSRSAWDNLFLRWEWIHTWWKHFSSHRQLFIWTITREDRLVGIFPLYIDQPAPLGFRYLRFCSDELSPDYLD